jgi:hypothetical protein
MIIDSDDPPNVLGTVFDLSELGAGVFFEVGGGDLILLPVSPNQIDSYSNGALFFLDENCDETAYALARSVWSAVKLYRTEETAAGVIIWVEDGDSVEDFIMSMRGDKVPFSCLNDGFPTSLLTLVPLRNTGINIDTVHHSN